MKKNDYDAGSMREMAEQEVWERQQATPSKRRDKTYVVGLQYSGEHGNRDKDASRPLPRLPENTGAI